MRARSLLIPALLIALASGMATACKKAETPAAAAPEPVWTELFAADLSNAEFPAGVWTVAEGVLTASEDQALWTKRDYENFVLDLEFMTAAGTNSGVIVYCSDMADWIPNSVEIQIADDFAEEWAKQPATWHCGAVFGHLAPVKSAVKPAGEWNRYTITCAGKRITVVLNGRDRHGHGHEPLDVGQDESRRERDPGLAQPAQGGPRDEGPDRLPGQARRRPDLVPEHPPQGNPVGIVAQAVQLSPPGSTTVIGQDRGINESL